MPAVLLEVFGHEIHRGSKRDGANNRAHHSYILALSDHTADNERNKKRQCRRDAASSILWSDRILFLVAHDDLLQVEMDAGKKDQHEIGS